MQFRRDRLVDSIQILGSRSSEIASTGLVGQGLKLSAGLCENLRRVGSSDDLWFCVEVNGIDRSFILFNTHHQIIKASFGALLVRDESAVDSVGENNEGVSRI